MDKIYNAINEHWELKAKNYLWKTPWKHILKGNFIDKDFSWFEGATLNLTENCIDRHLPKLKDKIALIFEPNDQSQNSKTYTYLELHHLVNKTCHAFSQLNIKKGDVICFYMGMTPDLFIGILAAAKMGAVFTVVFGGFSPLSLKERIINSNAKLLVTHDFAFRGDKKIPLKSLCDEALNNVTCIQNMLVYKNSNENIIMQPNRDIYFHELISIKKFHLDFSAEPMNAEDPLFILYTSGSTGKPKGLLHTTAGYMVYVGESFKEVFQTNQENDVFWCTADIGWITGHSYLTFGPLLNGTTTLLFEGIPTFPTPARFYETIEKHQVTHFYTAPTAIRALEKFGNEIPLSFKMPSLKVLGSVGEPINEEAWNWYNECIGKKRCPIVDTWWQTETGGILISPRISDKNFKPAFATKPLPQIYPDLVDEKGVLLLEKNTSGNLIIKYPWPGIARTIFGDHKRYLETYFSTYPNYYFTGDGAKRDEEGDYRITGRVDDVINVSGHRIGTAEVEEAINEHPAIVESAVVGVNHSIKGQAIFAFVIARNSIQNEQDLIIEIKNQVVKMIGALARPEEIFLVPALPKTRSGKIMRRILRKISENQLNELGDISTLLNPECVEEICKEFKKIR